MALPVVLAEHAARRWPGAAFGLQTQDRRGRGGVSDTVPVGHAGDADRLLGYAMIRAADAAGSWQWGDRVGTLETLVVGGSARGTGAGRELLDAARERLAEWGAQVMTISVIAGNEGAVRFYLREGASDYLHTLVMPVRQSLSPSAQELPICVPLDYPRAPSLKAAAQRRRSTIGGRQTARTRAVRADLTSAEESGVQRCVRPDSKTRQRPSARGRAGRYPSGKRAGQSGSGH